jgi:hypothetical protein
MTEASQAISAGKSTLHAGLRVVAQFIVPVVFVVAGFFTAQALGLPSALSSMVNKLGNGNISLSNIWRVCFGVSAALWGTIGYVFWGLRHHGGIIMEFIGGALGGYFLGVSLGNVPGLITGNGWAPGWIDRAIESAEGVATGST